MAFSGSFASNLSYQVPLLAATDLSGQNGGMGNNPAPPPEGVGQFVGNVAHSALNLGEAAFKGIAAPIVNLAHATLDVPFGVANAVGAVKELSARATGNETAYLHAQAQVGAQTKNSFVTKELQSPNNAANFGHAAELSGTAATLAAPYLESFARTGLPLADRLISSAEGVIGPGKGNILTKTVRNALLTQPTLQFVGKTAQDLQKGDVGASALDAIMWGLPAGASLAGKVIGAGAKGLGNALFGKSAILNDIFSPEAVSQYAKEHPEDLTTLKQIEQFTLNQEHVQGNTDLAGPWLKNYIEANIPGVTGDAKGLEKLVTTMKPYADEMQKLQSLRDQHAVIEGVPASRLTVSHNFVDAMPKAVDAIDKAVNDPKWQTDMPWRLQQVKQVMGSLGIADETLNAQFAAAMQNSNTPEEIRANLDEVMRAGQKQIVKDLGNGFIYTRGPNYMATMPSAEEVAGNTLAEGKSPSLPGVGQAITKAGLSPRATAPGAYEAALEDNLDQRLEDLHVGASGKDLLNLLRDKAKGTVGISDLRMLTAKNIEEAVTNDSELRQVPGKVLSAVVRGAYRDIPTEITGLGPKLTNAIMNPLLSQYLRVQGLGRFEANPVFLFGKVPLKGGIVAIAHGADVNEMAKAYIGLSKDTQNALREDVGGNWFVAGSRAGESGTSAEIGMGSTGKQVAGPIKKQIVSLVDSVAKANGTTADDIIAERGDLYNELQKSVSLIKGYGSGGYLNSPLAKTLNLLIFPSRFDTKVVMSAANIMGRMTALQQVAVIHSAAQFYGFMQSDQGKQWVQQNADALGLFSYFTPTETFQGVYNFLAHGQHVQDLGEIGGLPFGIITQAITHQVPSLGHLGASQYFDPKTGQPIPEAIPTTLKARAQQVLQDVISSMFSWPGKAAGLVSKKNVVTAGGKNPLVTPASNEVQYTYANGSTEGSPNAPQPQGGPAPQPIPALPGQAVAPNVPGLPGEAVHGTVSATPVSRAARPKSIPKSQQLPGSGAF